MMAVKYKRRGQDWAEYSATDKRNPAVNCVQDCFQIDWMFAEGISVGLKIVMIAVGVKFD